MTRRLSSLSHFGLEVLEKTAEEARIPVEFIVAVVLRDTSTVLPIRHQGEGVRCAGTGLVGQRLTASLSGSSHIATLALAPRDCPLRRKGGR